MEITVYILLGLIVLQQAYWSWQAHTLIDKLMSKNYAEYVQSKSFAKASPPKSTGPIVASDDEVLAELNKQFGL